MTAEPSSSVKALITELQKNRRMIAGMGERICAGLMVHAGILMAVFSCIIPSDDGGVAIGLLAFVFIVVGFIRSLVSMTEVWDLRKP